MSGTEIVFRGRDREVQISVTIAVLHSVILTTALFTPGMRNADERLQY
jgi:hypothetical protein